MRRSLILAILTLVLVPVGAVAQTVAVAQLTGTVLDQSGAALPGVEVSVTQTDTGMNRFVITGGQG